MNNPAVSVWRKREGERKSGIITAFSQLNDFTQHLSSVWREGTVLSKEERAAEDLKSLQEQVEEVEKRQEEECKAWDCMYQERL
ncbi:hypothetical protein E2C01_034771 [Portunus trituberculatus]|uniref:Uncharacterized protein n=1 Tax=Portunus trituberculatus TaxID=210409 RepID=A0A5B7F6E6_PORTR|nr:hypothetical protein [Portunus trituberculatus]